MVLVNQRPKREEKYQSENSVDSLHRFKGM